jgi:ABC-type polysaccharide transport system permease subunit
MKNLKILWQKSNYLLKLRLTIFYLLFNIKPMTNYVFGFMDIRYFFALYEVAHENASNCKTF